MSNRYVPYLAIWEIIKPFRYRNPYVTDTSEEDQAQEDWLRTIQERAQDPDDADEPFDHLLDELAHAAENEREARRIVDGLLMLGTRLGYTYRDLGEAAGLSHVTVGRRRENPELADAVRQAERIALQHRLKVLDEESKTTADRPGPDV